MQSQRMPAQDRVKSDLPLRGDITQWRAHTLSPREQEIARLVAIGYPNKTIAGILDISPWTVASHVRRIFNKLDVHGRPAMIAELARSGFQFERCRSRNGREARLGPTVR